MQVLLFGMSLLLSLTSVVLLIITVVKLFKEKGALHGILGIICGLYTFVWGWMHVKRHNSQAVMVVWTLVIIGSIVVQIAQFALALADS